MQGPNAESYPRVREYRISLDVNHETLWFAGTVEVVLEAAERRLRLNSVGLEIHPVSDRVRVTAHPELEEVWLDSPQPLGSFEVRFRGRAAERGLTGFYRSRFGDGHILTTQCAATGTRRLFPCVDRPDRKAVVRLRLTIDADLEAIFNTVPSSETLEDGRLVIEFQPTPPMATYLTYLAVGRFDWFRGPTERARVAAAAPPGRGASGRYAVERSRAILAAFEEYFGIPYPLPKLDLVAVPEFAYGAMENWGAISFREMRLLVDESTSVFQRRQTLSTIAHEIAHQWFGNLVTMAWWSDIWLNESFATLMEEKVVEQLYPEEGPLEDLLIEWFSPALAGDSLPVTHPVSVPVERPEAIDELFDVISYGKGSAVLRMVEGYLGADRFRRGVSRYLTSHAYGNATSDDLWNSLEAAADRPVRSLLTAWIARPGVPFLTARLEGGRVRWIQRRFSLDGRHVAERWPIPLGIGTRDGVRHELIEAEQGTLEIPRVGAVHLNPGALGFYRVLYDSPLYDRLFEGFDHLSAIDRWILLVDGSAFLLSGDLLPDAYLRLVDAAGRSPAPLLVHELANQLSSSSPGRHPTPLGALLGERAVFRDAARAALRGHLDRFGLDPVPSEPDDAALLRGRVASTLVPLDPEVAERLSGRFGEFDRAPPDLRWPIAFAYARSGAEREFEGLLAALDRPQSEGSALALERALVWFPDPGLVERALGLALTPKVNRAHLSNVVREAAYNPHGRAVTWAWINGNLRGAEADYKGTGIFANVLEQAMPFAGLGRSAEVRQELARRPFVDAERATQKGLVLLDLYERLLRAFS